MCWGREKRGTSRHFGMSPCGKKCTACPSCLCLPPPLPCVCSRRTCLGPRGPQGRAGGRQASTSAYSRSRSTRVPPKRTARAGGRAARHGGGGSAARREGMQGWASERPRRGPFAASAACGVASTSAARADPPRRHPGAAPVLPPRPRRARRDLLRRPTPETLSGAGPHGTGAGGGRPAGAPQGDSQVRSRRCGSAAPPRACGAREAPTCLSRCVVRRAAADLRGFVGEFVAIISCRVGLGRVCASALQPGVRARRVPCGGVLRGVHARGGPGQRRLAGAEARHRSASSALPLGPPPQPCRCLMR